MVIWFGTFECSSAQSKTSEERASIRLNSNLLIARISVSMVRTSYSTFSDLNEQYFREFSFFISLAIISLGKCLGSH